MTFPFREEEIFEIYGQWCFPCPLKNIRSQIVVCQEILTFLKNIRQECEVLCLLFWLVQNLLVCCCEGSLLYLHKMLFCSAHKYIQRESTPIKSKAIKSIRKKVLGFLISR